MVKTCWQCSIVSDLFMVLSFEGSEVIIKLFYIFVELSESDQLAALWLSHTVGAFSGKDLHDLNL